MQTAQTGAAVVIILHPGEFGQLSVLPVLLKYPPGVFCALIGFLDGQGLGFLIVDDAQTAVIGNDHAGNIGLHILRKDTLVGQRQAHQCVAKLPEDDLVGVGRAEQIDFCRV